jgi:nucleoside-diphosphate-sugar epimerase
MGAGRSGRQGRAAPARRPGERGPPHRRRGQRAGQAGFREGNVTGTLNVVEAALNAGVPRLVHVSSLSARRGFRSTARRSWGERMVKASCLDWTVVRPPAVYGPRDTEMFELFKLARRGVVPLPPEAGSRSSMSAISPACCWR